MRALALQRAADYGDQAARGQARAALRAAASAGAVSTFFTRLRLAEARLQGTDVPRPADGCEELLAAWDRLIDRHGAEGPRFDRWSRRLISDLRSSDHDTVARAVAEVGAEVLGLSAAAPTATAGEEDAYWELTRPRRTLTFEVKLAPVAQRVVNDDEQAEGAAKAAEGSRGNGARGVLITPHESVDATAAARLERVRLLKRELFITEVERLLAVVREYRRGWSDNAVTRAERRAAVAPDLPRVDWLWEAIERSSNWVERETLDHAWQAGATA